MDKNIDENSGQKKTCPLVSIIIAVHNGASFIDDCLSAIVNQTYNNLEIIICDDASTDNSIAHLESWRSLDSRIVVLKNETNLFAGATRNRCFKVAKGKYLCLQDIDDVSHLDRVEKLVNVLEAEDVDFVSSAMECFDRSIQDISTVMVQKNEYPNKNNFLWGISFNHPATMFTSTCINDVGGYRISPETRRCEDYDLFMRLYQKGYKGKNISEPLYYYRYDRETIHRGATKASVLGEYHVRKKNYAKFNFPYVVSLFFAFKPFASYVISKIRAHRI